MGKHDRTVVLGMLVLSFFSLMYARKKNVRKRERETDKQKEEEKNRMGEGSNSGTVSKA